MNFGTILLAAGVAGILCGTLGSGGGIPLLLFLRSLLPNRQAECFPLCVTIISLLVGISLVLRTGEDALHLAHSAPMLFPALAGGILGANLLGQIKTAHLTRLFALLCLIGGIRMLFF